MNNTFCSPTGKLLTVSVKPLALFGDDIDTDFTCPCDTLFLRCVTLNAHLTRIWAQAVYQIIQSDSEPKVL